MTDFTILSRFRNRDAVESLVQELQKRGKSCYNFCEVPSDPNNPDAHPEEQMKVFEATEDFLNDDHFKLLFERDLNGLKNAETAILLLPGGTSSHIEIGIAFGLGKKCVLIGTPEKPESLYHLFDEYYDDVPSFLSSL